METNARANSGTSRPDERGTISPGSGDPFKRLAAAILAKAAKEAKAGDLDALFWLLSEQAEILSNGIGLSWPHVQKWARARLQLQNDKTKRARDLVDNRGGGVLLGMGGIGRAIPRT